MDTKKICDNVYYVGVNDHATEKFENLWPLPYGVSYNSYVVKGAKTALIDTCRDGFEGEYLNKIRNIIGENGTVDYLVVNHMEPDHSGLIPNISKLFPGIKIVADKIATGMIKGFYHIDDDSLFHIVTNGEKLDLGDGLTLKFVFTPMVHWPETMMTYIPEREVLFSGDAFGCFGALGHDIIDDEITDLPLYYDEMYRYYSNIVGKYGTPVTRALNALSSYSFKYICSTHGPIWHSQIAKVIDIYSRLSRYEGEEGVCIVYGSMYGNTKILAEKMADSLKAEGISPVILKEATFDNLSFVISDAFRYRGLIIGSPTYSMSLFPPVGAFVKAMEVREIKNKVISVFGSYAWAPGAMKELETIAANNKWQIASKMSMSMSMSEKSEADLKQFVTDFFAAYRQ